MCWNVGVLECWNGVGMFECRSVKCLSECLSECLSVGVSVGVFECLSV